MLGCYAPQFVHCFALYHVRIIAAGVAANLLKYGVVIRCCTGFRCVCCISVLLFFCVSS